MTAQKDRFWAKVLFKEFIRHFRKLNDEEIANDVKQSMDDLDDLNDSGTSFGSKMVRWSLERKESPSAIASRENGSKGGRPPNNPPKEPWPKSKEEFWDFVNSQDLPIDFATEWFEVHNARKWKDHNGNPLSNWKGALIKYCKAKDQ